MPYLAPSTLREQTIVNFGSLGILVPLLEKLNIANIIDRHIPTDPQAYMTLERLYRQTVPADAKLSERRMTAERILNKFRTCSLTVEEQAYGDLVHVARLNRVQRTILTQLSLATPTEILRKNLLPPPA